MSKHKFSTGLRRTFKGVVDDIATVITMKLKEATDNEIELDDVEGSLIFNHIDDQESEVISSVYLRYDPNKPDKSRIVAKVAGYGDEYDVTFADLNIELMFNVLEAVEKATE